MALAGRSPRLDWLLLYFPCLQQPDDARHLRCWRGKKRSRSRGGNGGLLMEVARRVDLHALFGGVPKDIVFVVVDGVVGVCIIFAASQQGVV